MTIPTPRRLTQLAALAAMAVVLPLTGAATSQAAWDDFECALPSGTQCADTRHSLRLVSAYTSTGRMVGSGASTTGSPSTVVGGMVWGTTYTCSFFDGSRLLYPMIANGSSVTLRVEGTAEFGSGVYGC
jgi:hypothetical protein